MLDIRLIRERIEELEQVAVIKGVQVDLRKLLSLDDERKELLQIVERWRAERNQQSQRMAKLAGEGGEASTDEAMSLREAIKEGNRQASEAEERLKAVEAERDWLLLNVPNVVSADTPIGQSDAENVELRRVGAVPEWEGEVPDHVALGERWNLFDLPHGVKVAGTRSYYLKGAGMLLQRAVQQLALDMLHERGFTLMDVPLMVKEEAMLHTGFFPGGREQTYQVAADDKWLVGTSEVPLVSYYSGEVLDLSRPLRLAAVSHCFRREAGSAGRDVRGLYRVHQFAKVEQVILCEADPELAERLLEEITCHAEALLQRLELPYRVVAVCTGDMGLKNYKQYDIETWMPSRGSYGETHSSSSLLDFQARRSNIRYRDGEGSIRYAYTLNNTMAATPRLLIPLLENHCRADGTITVPSALRPYLYGMDRIGE